jgi:hypothetical protein
MGDGRSDADKQVWHCKHCPGHKNFAHRVTCHKCGIAKGKAFLRVASGPSKPPTTSSLAESQKRIKQLEAQLVANKEVARKELERAKKLPTKEPKEVEEVDDDEEDAGYSLDMLYEQKAMFTKQGKHGEKDLARVLVDISAKHAAQLAKKPVLTQLKQAEQKVSKARAALASLESKVEPSKEKVEAMQIAHVELLENVARAKQSLEESEAAKAEVVKNLAGSPAPPPAVDPVSAAGYVAITATLPDIFFTQASFTRDQVNGLLANLVAGHEAVAAAQRASDAAAAATRAEAEGVAKLQLEKVAAEQKALAAAAPPPSPSIVAPPPGTLNGSLVLDDELMLELQNGLSGQARKKFDLAVEDSKRRRLAS